MKSFKKILLAGLFPVLAFTTPSCSGVCTAISFDKAIAYAQDHFDPYALDFVSENISADINSLMVKGVIDVTNTTTTVKHQYDISAGLKGLNFVLSDGTALSVNSNIVSLIGANYNNFASLFSAISDTNPIDLKYYIISNGLAFDLNAKAGDKFMDTIFAINSALNVDHFALHKLLQIPNDESTIGGTDRPAYLPDYITWKQYIAECIASIAGLPFSAWEMITEMLPINELANFIRNIYDYDYNETNPSRSTASGIYSMFQVGIDASSKSFNDKFTLNARTNNKGFLTNARLVLKTDLSLTTILTSLLRSSFTLVAKVALSIDFDISLKAKIK